MLPEFLVLLLSQNFMVVCNIYAHKFPQLLFESTAMLHTFCNVHAFAEEKNVHGLMYYFFPSFISLAFQPVAQCM